MGHHAGTNKALHGFHCESIPNYVFFKKKPSCVFFMEIHPKATPSNNVWIDILSAHMNHQRSSSFNSSKTISFGQITTLQLVKIEGLTTEYQATAQSVRSC